MANDLLSGALRLVALGVLLTLCVAFLRVAPQLRAMLKHRAALLAFDLLERTVRTFVADREQRVVRELKDARTTSVWDDRAAAAQKGAVIADATDTAPAQIDALRRAGVDVARLLGPLVEASVLELKRVPSVPPAPLPAAAKIPTVFPGHELDSARPPPRLAVPPGELPPTKPETPSAKRRL